MPKINYDDLSAEELGKIALAKGIKCDPLADSREDILKKLKPSS